MIGIEVAGQNFTGWTEAQVKKCLDVCAGTFQFTVSAPGTNAFPIKRRSAVKITIDGATVLTGYVDKLKCAYSSLEHEITVTGRGRTADIIDSTVDGHFEFNGTIGLVDLIKQMLDYYEITGIDVINAAGEIDPFDESDAVSSPLGTSVFDAIETYCRLRAVLLTENDDGNIVLFRATSLTDSGVKLTHKNDGSVNNIKSSQISFDDSERFNKYKIWSQGNVAQLANTTDGLDDPGADSNSISDMGGDDAEATDGEIRSTRILNKLAEHAVDADDLQARATWEANIRRSRSIEYSPTVVGHTKTGKGDPWKLYETAPIEDIFADVSGTLLIKEITFKLDLTTGTTTELTMTNKDAYTLQAEEDQRDARDNNIGGQFQDNSATINQGLDDDSTDSSTSQ